MDSTTAVRGFDAWAALIDLGRVAMKWFKHQTSARDDEGLIALRTEFGFDGYGRYWAILETVAGRSRNDSFDLSLSVAEWCLILSTKPKQLRWFLERSENLTLMKWFDSGNVIRISVPKLAKYRDEYAQKSRHSPKSVGTVDTDTEVEEERDTHTTVVVPAARVSASPDPRPQPTNDQIASRWDAAMRGLGLDIACGQIGYHHAEMLFRRSASDAEAEAVGRHFVASLSAGINASPARFVADYAIRVAHWKNSLKPAATTGGITRCGAHPGGPYDRKGNCERCASARNGTQQPAKGQIGADVAPAGLRAPEAAETRVAKGAA